MRISKTQARENHQFVVMKAADLFRERGFDSVSVSDLMKAAGFTHGGFYNHFGSKDALSAEALDHAFRLMDEERARAKTLDDLLSGYLSHASRCAPGKSCPAAALAGDVARGSEAMKSVFAEGLERMVASLAARLPFAPAARSDAINLLTRMVGALILARATPESSALGAEILSTALEACRRDMEGAATSADEDLKA